MMLARLQRISIRSRILALLVAAVVLTTGLSALMLSLTEHRPPPDLQRVSGAAAAREMRMPPPDALPPHLRGDEQRMPGADRRPPPPGPHFSLTPLLWAMLIALMAIVPLGWLLTSMLTGWLSQLSESARKLGTTQQAAALPLNTAAAELHNAAWIFNEMQERVLRQIQERTHMVGAMAHDLRTPLTRLAFRLEALQEPLHSRVEADIREMNMMVSAAMEFIREQSLHDEHVRLDMQLLVEGMVDDLADMGHDVQMQDGQDGTPITLTGDPVALKRMIGNLLDNALKYGGSARVCLSVQGPHCVLQIDDEGPGIPEALRTRVFEPFFRVETSRSRETGGMGLGLATVHSIVQEHAGTIALANRRSGGLRVTVQLPLHNAQAIG